MPLLGKAAMLLGFDIEAAAIAEHDDWHTHEHLPERLSIPGFLRGTRWVAIRGAPRYTVLYEVDRLETLGSAAYLERLNRPTAWTSKMMPHYLGMTRGLCTVEGSWGQGLGHFGLVVRFKRAAGSASHDGLESLLSGLPLQAGLGSVHLLKGALDPAMTAEQRLRGRDAQMDWAVLATGYEMEAVAALQEDAFGLAGASSALYQMAYSMLAGDVAP